MVWGGRREIGGMGWEKRDRWHGVGEERWMVWDGRREIDGMGWEKRDGWYGVGEER